MVNDFCTPPRVIGLIPARWGSSRFPGKPLHILAGKPLVRHVWEQVGKCTKLAEIAIATDDDRIREAAEGFGARVIMTSPDHPSGSDRLAEALDYFPDATHVVNIQGDEPMIDPSLVDELADALLADAGLSMATAATELRNEGDFKDPNIVKVVLAANGDALYFSRAMIPYPRVAGIKKPLRHLGLYAYRADFLKQFVKWEPSSLELCESLEQLRALENGARIRVIMTDHQGPGVDTPEQAAMVEELLK